MRDARNCRIHGNNYPEFEYEIGMALIRFYAPWCTSCVKNAPFFEQLAQLFDASVKFGKVNVDQSPILTLRYQVFDLPTTLIFKEGQIVERLSGNVSVAELQQKIQSYL